MISRKERCDLLPQMRILPCDPAAPWSHQEYGRCQRDDHGVDDKERGIDRRERLTRNRVRQQNRGPATRALLLVLLYTQAIITDQPISVRINHG